MEAKGKELVCKILEAENVRYIFGNPGSTEIPLLDNLCNYPDIKYVLCLHENIAVSMADGYARASGKPGVVNVHAAPGTAHSLGGLFNAYTDNVPLVLISGQQDSRVLLREPFLSADLARLTKPFTKWSWQVSRGEELAVAVRRAFKESTAAPCGPVFLSISRNVLDEMVDAEVVPPEKYRVPQCVRGDLDEITKAAELLIGAENPVIIAGIGVASSGGVHELVRLAEVIGARVYAEPCSFPTDHSLFAGPVEVRTVHKLAQGSDVLMVVGAPMFTEFSYSPTPSIPPGVKAIHLDIDPWEIAKNYPVDAAIVADPRIGLRELVLAVQGLLDAKRFDAIDERKARIAKANQDRAESLAKLLDQESESEFIRGSYLAVCLREVLDDDAIIVEQGIRSATYLKRYFHFRKPGTYYSEKGGALGWGVAAAIGVKLARPDKQVVAFVGDGCTMYYPQALWTAAQENVPIVVILLNNGGYLAVKSLTMGYGGESLKQQKFIGADIAGIDYVKMAESFGVFGVKVEGEGRLKSTLEEAVGAGRPVLVEVVLDPRDAGFGLPRVP